MLLYAIYHIIAVRLVTCTSESEERSEPQSSQIFSVDVLAQDLQIMYENTEHDVYYLIDPESCVEKLKKIPEIMT